MATPIPNLGQHTENRVDKDAYNFYHSQLRINIECTFSILLVNRFGWLRKQAPVQYSTIKKTMATVSCFCNKLHNFLIYRRFGADNTTEQETIAEMTPQDGELNLAVEGGVPLEGVGNYIT